MHISTCLGRLVGYFWRLELGLRFVTESGKIYAVDPCENEIVSFNPGDTTAVTVMTTAEEPLDILVQDESLYVLSLMGRVFEYALPPLLELEWSIFSRETGKHIAQPGSFCTPCGAGGIHVSYISMGRLRMLMKNQWLTQSACCLCLLEWTSEREPIIYSTAVLIAWLDYDNMW